MGTEVVATEVDGGVWWWWWWLGSPQLAGGCWLGLSCRCEIKPVDNEDLSEEKQERNIKENLLLHGAQTTPTYASLGLCLILVPLSHPLFVLQPFVHSEVV